MDKRLIKDIMRRASAAQNSEFRTSVFVPKLARDSCSITKRKILIFDTSKGSREGISFQTMFNVNRKGKKNKSARNKKNENDKFIIHLLIPQVWSARVILKHPHRIFDTYSMVSISL